MTDLILPRLSVIIVTYNSRDHIDQCLGSLAEHAPSIDHDIVVVDNASPDNTSAAIRARWTGVRVIEAGANLGFARANNLGIQQTAGALILLLNPDTIVPAGSIDALVSALDAMPDAAVAGPRLVDGDGRAELSFGAMMSPLAELRQKALVRGNDRGIRAVSAYVEWLTHRPREVDWVSGACLLVRRADAEAVGLMDERYFMFAEDVDFCAAVRARGRRVLFAPSAEVVHLRGRSRATAPAATERAYRRSQIAFYEKHHPRWAPALRLYLKMLGRLPDTSITP
jgi:N-acetylglucosaminyl-diphospho-decaprenol L-rhamnosyltransferase